MRKHFEFVIISLLVVFANANAQEEAIVRDEMNKVLAAYKTDGIMRLTIKTDLVLSTRPQSYIEKSEGSYYLSKDRVLGNIDDGSTYLQNGKWTVLMLTDQKLMYVDSVRDDAAINPKANPVQLLDSTFFVPGAIYSLTDVGTTERLIQVHYPADYAVLESKMWFDKETHLLTKAQYTTPYTEPVVYSDTASISDNYSGPPRFYTLTMTFTQTWPEDASEELFDEKQYFRIIAGKKFVPSALYKDYNIVLAFKSEEEETEE